MDEMYFDIEIAYTDPAIIERLRKGLKTPSPRAENCRIITIQYQLLNSEGRPKSPLRIFREWESSEEEIIKKATALINPQRMWEFIPVGHNIYFDLGMFKDRAAVYGVKYSNHFIYNDLPAIDIKHICVGMNAFQLKDSGLDKFTGKETSGAMVPVWYHDKDYQRIIDYIEKETKEFVEFYAKLKKALPEFRKQQGFF